MPFEFWCKHWTLCSFWKARISNFHFAKLTTFEVSFRIQYYHQRLNFKSPFLIFATTGSTSLLWSGPTLAAIAPNILEFTKYEYTIWKIRKKIMSSDPPKIFCPVPPNLKILMWALVMIWYRTILWFVYLSRKNLENRARLSAIVKKNLSKQTGDLFWCIFSLNFFIPWLLFWWFFSRRWQRW